MSREVAGLVIAGGVVGALAVWSTYQFRDQSDVHPLTWLLFGAFLALGVVAVVRGTQDRMKRDASFRSRCHAAGGVVMNDRGDSCVTILDVEPTR